MAAVGTINLNYARIGDYNQTLPQDQNPNNPITIAQYCLYNREFPGNNFNINNHNYLAYEGGFITEDDKISFKDSNLEIRTGEPTPSSGGNLSVSGNSTFFSNINLLSQAGQVVNTVKNVRRLNSVNELNSTIYDRDPIALGDFKRFFYQPGMMTFYNGTWENLRDNMPLWRICAAPDAGLTINVTYADGSVGTVTVPNLLGKFLPGAKPLDLEAGDTEYRYGSTGGVDAVKLSEDQMRSHSHGISVTLQNNSAPTLGGGLTYYSGGGIVSISSRVAAGVCSTGGYTCPGCTCSATCRIAKCRDDDGDPKPRNCTYSLCSRATNCQTSFFGPSYTSIITNVTQAGYTFRRLKFQTTTPSIAVQSEQNRGNNQAHENRPQFFGLIPIIYVGVKR